MTSQTSQGAERRQSKRYDYCGSVTVLRADTGATQSGLLVNLSMGGCLLKLKSPEERSFLPHLETDPPSRDQASPGDFGKDSVVEALFQVGYLPFLVTGTVRRCDEDGSLIGLAFQGMSPWGRGDLQRLFSNLETEPN